MLNQLKMLLNHPEPPLGVRSLEEWMVVESRFSLKLPADYRSFCFHYGIGHIRDESIAIDVLNPFSGSYDRRVRELLKSSACLSGVLDSRRYQTFDVHPKSPGLVPWAMDDLGNQFVCFAHGAPDQQTG